ncbi:hypothetical protein ASL11_35060 [Paenibacillus sp. Soil750]|nr:hypothetical protein ASL11_35060 [Paenibacillus sp. Soil750]
MQKEKVRAISGKFTATINRITKRGSSRLRHALYMVVLCGLRRTGSKKLKAFYDKKWPKENLTK